MEVIVLAGGLGTRLRSVVADTPKCLAPVGDKPFLGWLLEWLELYEVSHVVFSVGYLREQVIDYVKSREWPFAYDFAVEESPLGTGGGIRLALEKCREKQVFVVNGDTFYPVDLNALPFCGPVTVALKPMQDFDRYGAVEVSSGLSAEHTSVPQHASASVMPDLIGHLLITAFHEKQPCRKGLINGGVYAIDRSLLDLSGLPEKFSFEKDVLEPGAAKGQIGGWVSDAYFIDIGVPEDYETAQWAIPGWFAVRKAFQAVLAADADTLFLDRDGVLNRHLEGDYVKSWQEWEWMPGILEALAKWSRKFRYMVLVTNQRGVGRGVMSDADLGLIHARMLQAIDAAGGRLDLVLVCTAVDDADPRRKPNTGMFQEACALLPDIDPTRCIMVGDSPKDALFAARCGMQFILLSPEGVS